MGRNTIERTLCIKAYMLLKQRLHEEFGIKADSLVDYVGYDKPVLINYHLRVHLN